MKLADGTILENVAAEDIQVTNASLAEGHGGNPAKRDDEKEKEDMEQARKQRKERETHQRKIRREGDESDLDEAAKPDYIDIDGDGDKEESMKDAAKDKEMKEGGRADRSENSEQGEERRMKHADRVRESVLRLHNAGYSSKQIKESLTSAFNKAKKG